MVQTLALKQQNSIKVLTHSSLTNDQYSNPFPRLGLSSIDFFIVTKNYKNGKGDLVFLPVEFWNLKPVISLSNSIFSTSTLQLSVLAQSSEVCDNK
ncbi:MAG: hypothetical protein HC825_12045 [Oscillatoriales cyanobacterium RM1_1_9]|nr:hypothetical protein [Oscillatoriales cyanobacterium SM2_3_0]NJO45625.1 hypothetical protein [Oscillatoriales cyanobacterium RM2_1_1]NJO72199.1 hypothetical protein [Oscillatoriales cyanobacterium RM1_1_9]